MYVGGTANMQIFNEIIKFCRQKAYSIFKTGLKKIKKENFISYVCAVGCFCFLMLLFVLVSASVSMWCTYVYVCAFVIAKVPIAYRIRIYFWTIHKALPCLMDESSKFNWYMNWNMNKTKVYGAIIFAMVWISKVVCLHNFVWMFVCVFLFKVFKKREYKNSRCRSAQQ